jgi:Pyruvate/2-oxoacid:ferredoxin oxidoreductase delta subunit
VRPISKDAAKDLVTDWRSRGAWQSVGWLWDANVIWLCNCDEYCSSYRAPEVEWAGVPSAVVTMVGDATACSGCGECATWCKQAGALHFGPGGRISHVDESFCRGCGLCVDHCPNGVLSYKPREEYYDVITKSVRSLGNDAIRF